MKLFKGFIWFRALVFPPLLVPSSPAPGTKLPGPPPAITGFFSPLESMLSQWERRVTPPLSGGDNRATPFSPTCQVKGVLHTLPHRAKPGFCSRTWKRKLSFWGFYFPDLISLLKQKEKEKREMCSVKEVGIRAWTSYQSTVFLNRSAALFLPLLG